MTEHVPSPELRPRDFSARLTRRDCARPLVGPRRHAGRRVAVLAAAIAVPAMANPGAGPIAGAGSWPGIGPAEVGPNEFAMPDGSFPGPALHNPDDLPNLRKAAGLPPADRVGIALPRPPAGGIVSSPPARSPFAAGTALDRVRARQCLAMAIYYEAAREPEAGQRAVAQVVLNRVAHRAYPDTVCGVVFQGSERATGCQFSFTCDGSLARRPVQPWWNRAMRIAREALAGRVYAPVGLATHYHAVAVRPWWAGGLDSVGTIGSHRFYRWRGAAGGPMAFGARYAGGEPAAAPRPRAARPGPDTADPPALARGGEASIEAPPPDPVTLAANDAEEPAPAGPFAGSGRVRPEYARSGQWIRQP